MKITKLAVGVGLLAGSLTSTVGAQETLSPRAHTAPMFAVGVQESSYTSSLWEDAAAPTPEPQVDAEAGYSSSCEGTCDPCLRRRCCDPCCGDCGVFRRWQARDPWTLPQPCLLQCLGIKAGGWLQAGITANAEDPPDRYNGPNLTNDREGELQLHQLWLYFERPCDTGGCGVDIGGRFDVFFGTDWRAALCHGQGLEDRINGFNQMYGMGIPQFYVEAAVNKLSIKMGRMAGILGYEMIPPMGNFFYSHSYTICYTEPLLITGLMGKYQLADQLTALAGFHQGFHRVEDNNDELSFQGGLIWTSCDKATSLAYALDTGPVDDAGLIDEYVHSIVFKRQLTKRTLYVIQSNVGFLDGVGKQTDAEWYSIVQYLIYTLNDRWSAGMRVEWFRDDDGARIMGVGNLPDARGWMGAPGYAGHFTGLTVGLNWRPKPNVIFRPEVRWDGYNGLANRYGPHPLPYDAGTDDDQLTVAADLVVMF